MIRRVDAKGRVILSTKHAGEYVLVKEAGDGGWVVEIVATGKEDEVD